MSGDTYTPRYPSSQAADNDAIPSDTPYIPGTLGALTLAVRNDGAATVLGTVDGNMTPIAVNQYGEVFITTSSTNPLVVGGPGAQGAVIDNTNWYPVEISLESETQHSNGGAFSVNVPVGADGDVVRPKGSRYGVQYFCPTDATGGVSYMHNPATVIPVKSLNAFNTAPTQEIYNYSTAQGDGTASRATDATWDFAGPTLTSVQLCRVVVILAGGATPFVWEQGKNALITIAAGGTLGQIITIASFDGVGAPIPASYVAVVVMWHGVEKETTPRFTHSTEYGDATVAYTSANTITLTAALGNSLPTTPQIAEVIVVHADTTRSRYVNGSGCFINMAGGLLTIGGCASVPFVAGDATFIVRWNIYPKTTIRGGTKGTSTPLDDTVRALSPNINVLDVWNNEPQTHMSNYSCSRGDAPNPTWVSGTTMTWLGPTLTSWQFRKVAVFIDTSSRPLLWEQGVNANISISGTTITVTPLDGTVAPLGGSAPLAIDVMWTAQDKAYDPSLQALRNGPMYSDRSYRTSLTPTQLIAAPQVFTTGAVALGPAIQVDGEKWLRGFFSWVKNNGTATTFQVQAMFMHTAGGTPFPLEVLKVDTSAVPYVVSSGKEFINLATVDQSDLGTWVWDLENTVGFVQFYIIAATPGAAGGLGPGTMATAEYTLGY